jgi:hypothetical protein
MFGKIPDNQQHALPMHESQRESLILRPPSEKQRDKQLDQRMFDQQLRDLCSNDSILFDSGNRRSKFTFHNTSDSTNDSNMFQSVYLGSPEPTSSSLNESFYSPFVNQQKYTMNNSISDTLSDTRYQSAVYDPLLHNPFTKEKQKSQPPPPPFAQKDFLRTDPISIPSQYTKSTESLLSQSVRSDGKLCWMDSGVTAVQENSLEEEIDKNPYI